MPMLPYLEDAELQAQGGATLIASVPCSIWPSRAGAVTATGRAYDHEGEAPLSFADDLRQANVKLVLNNTTYAVVDAIPQNIVPHVTLRLREMRAGG